MSILQVENLYKTYGEKTLFDHISFTIAAKQRIGLIGVNGTGKSTLLKVIAGIESADSGEITHSNTIRIEYLSQQPELTENLTILEQIYYGDAPIMQVMREYELAQSELERDPENETKLKHLMNVQAKMDQHDAWEANTVAKTILTKLGITDFQKPVNHLSGGQKKRVAIAKALIQPADILILDEPTNHLDNETIEWLEGFLAQYKGSIVLITHDRYFLNRVTNQIFELDQGQLYTYSGNYEVFLEKKAEREMNAELAEEKRQNLLRRELAWLRRGAKARTTKQKARIGRAEELQEQKGPAAKQDLDFSIGSTRLGKKVLELEHISKAYDGRSLINDFSYLITPGERLGIIGPNGTGKSTLLNIMAGRIKADQGTIDVGTTVKIGFYTQEHEEMDENLRVIEYIKETAEVVYTIDNQVITAEQMLERFLFPRSAQWTYIRKLSGGERRRLYLLKVLMEEPNVLFLDEPTNDLDTQTLSVLEDYLDQFPGVVLTVSHDRYFLDRVVDHLIVFESNGNITRFQGSYSDFMEEKKLQEMNSVKEETATDKTSYKKDKKKRLSYKEQQEWEGIEDKIAELEERKEQLEQEIAAAGSDLGKVQELYKEQEKVEQTLDETMERWEELSLLVEEIEQSK
ncbi:MULTISPECIES: ABC-F family ATP-binding cassette domain-containing protein [Bacillaceae]|uniref:ABC-F family ATP-binding cassette domain-containing protein n=1 Tax=Bacillaceae TaxID=186817 RepID=UPI000BFDC30E|nr:MULTISPECIES: ABC-F family ATP-binding cassette domain-containing protein [Bacillaceae]PGT79068.1 multidrug ABC transporter ATP-binding protein [Bacillus sp. AFS040349]UGB31413.1 ABC-F family ATP-binding cassette domain-containing protein [Metabacillus sp. B2-18]